jgi:hypothetical protein
MTDNAIVITVDSRSCHARGLLYHVFIAFDIDLVEVSLWFSRIFRETTLELTYAFQHLPFLA